MQTTSACKPSGDEVLFNREGWKFRKGRELTSGMDLGSLRCEKGWNFHAFTKSVSRSGSLGVIGRSIWLEVVFQGVGFVP
jgi:hypothetical protein